MSDLLYQEIILSLYKNPLNKTALRVFDESKKETNHSCGDKIEIFLKWENKKIKDIGWTGEGCAISQASASLLTEYVKNKSVDQINKINRSKILKMLGIKELNPSRLRCAMLPLEALKK